LFACLHQHGAEKDARRKPLPKREPLSWAPPELTDPVTINISETNRTPRLDVTKDYIIKMPDKPLKVPGGLVLSGGRNVVLIGGAIEAPSIEVAPKSLERRAVYLKGQAGTITSRLVTWSNIFDGTRISRKSHG
jgi:hypothetical protein